MYESLWNPLDYQTSHISLTVDNFIDDIFHKNYSWTLNIIISSTNRETGGNVDGYPPSYPFTNSQDQDLILSRTRSRVEEMKNRNT